MPIPAAFRRFRRAVISPGSTSDLNGKESGIRNDGANQTLLTQRHSGNEMGG
jgi:hypothetical protein